MTLDYSSTSGTADIHVCAERVPPTLHAAGTGCVAAPLAQMLPLQPRRVSQRGKRAQERRRRALAHRLLCTENTEVQTSLFVF